VLCPSCAAENREGARFCLTCGASLALSCVGCGKELPSGASFCDSCGQAVGAPPSEHTPTPTPAPSRALPASFDGGRYQVQRFLGEGGRKRVYLAHDTKLDRDVAIAVIKTEGLDAAGLARVHREAQAMGRLGDHPHIVTVHDIGDEDGRPYIGIHAGDVIREGNNVYGGAVNIAARIAAASPPGEVLVSDTVRSLARTSAGVTFDDRGEHVLKGVADPQRLFAVREGNA